ncbi:MAG: alpha/beta hydrolase, partial [Bacteroidota bacterium]
MSRYLLALLALAFPLGVWSQPASTNSVSDRVDEVAELVIGDTFLLQSEVLGETRRVNVYAPASYHASDTLRLPVLYMPD